MTDECIDYESLIKSKPYMLSDVANHDNYTSLVDIAMGCDPFYISIAQKTKTTYDMWLTACTKDGLLLEYCPQKFKTLDLCLLALKQTPYSIEFVPSGLLGMNQCLSLAKQMHESDNDNYDDYCFNYLICVLSKSKIDTIRQRVLTKL